MEYYIDSAKIFESEIVREDKLLIEHTQKISNERIDSKKKIEPAPKIMLEGVAAKVLEAIPLDKFITDEEILMQIEETNPNELPSIILELEIKGYVIEEAGRYKRKL